MLPNARRGTARDVAPDARRDEGRIETVLRFADERDVSAERGAERWEAAGEGSRGAGEGGREAGEAGRVLFLGILTASSTMRCGRRDVILCRCAALAAQGLPEGLRVGLRMWLPQGLVAYGFGVGVSDLRFRVSG